MQNSLQSKLEAEHNSHDSFVKSQQAKLAQYAGKAPNLKGELLMTNANMLNDGQHAQMFAKSLTSGIDNVAYPVKGK